MKILDIVYAFLLGIIEGVTEWLPISSTAHLMIFEKSNLLNEMVFTPVFMEMFNVVIQLGAILAIVYMYFKKLWPFGNSEGKKEKWSIWYRIILACIPAIIIGLLFDDYISQMFYNLKTIAISLIIYGVLFLIVERIKKNKTAKTNEVSKIKFRDALIIGLAQVLAIIPGTSRSGITIIIGLLLSLDRKTSIEFSFFLSIPMMVGASVLKIVKFANGNTLITSQFVLLLIGMVSAFLVSMIVVKWLTSFVTKHSFKGFAIYRIILGIIIYLFLIR